MKNETRLYNINKSCVILDWKVIGDDNDDNNNSNDIDNDNKYRDGMKIMHVNESDDKST